MIKTKELRIGNLIIVKYPNYLYPVEDKILPFEFEFTDEIESRDMEIDPIPLTEEWLVKNGW